MEIIMLNQLSQTQWDQNYMVSLQNINLKCVGGRGYALLSHKTKKEILRGQEEIFRQVENTGKTTCTVKAEGTAGDGVGGAERNEDRV